MKYLMSVDFLYFRAVSDIHLDLNMFSNGIYKFANGINIKLDKNLGRKPTTYWWMFRIQYNDINLGYLYYQFLGNESSSNIMVRIENRVFYLHDLSSVLKMITESLKMYDVQIKRLDICMDVNFS